jgi:hypothetical protein
MCTVLLPLAFDRTAVNKYIISYHISCHIYIIYHVISHHITSHHISYRIMSYHNISYQIISHIMSYHISNHIISYRIIYQWKVCLAYFFLYAAKVAEQIKRLKCTLSCNSSLMFNVNFGFNLFRLFEINMIIFTAECAAAAVF